MPCRVQPALKLCTQIWIRIAYPEALKQALSVQRLTDGAASAGQRNRKRALPPKAEDSSLEEAEPVAASAGRKSEPEAVLALPVGLEAVTPPPQRRKSMAGTHNQHVMLLYVALRAGQPKCWCACKHTRTVACSTIR